MQPCPGCDDAEGKPREAADKGSSKSSRQEQNQVKALRSPIARPIVSTAGPAAAIGQRLACYSWGWLPMT